MTTIGAAKVRQHEHQLARLCTELHDECAVDLTAAAGEIFSPCFYPNRSTDAARALAGLAAGVNEVINALAAELARLNQ